MKRRAVLAAVIAVATLVTGIGSAGAAPGAAAKTVRGGSVTILKQTEAPAYGWDPVRFQGTQSAFEAPQAFAIFDMLFYEDAATLKLVPRLGLLLTSPDSGKTWTLKLRANVKFTDGTPFNADAVKFNWQRYPDPTNLASTLAASAANAIQTMDVVDATTLRVTLKVADPNWNLRVAEKLAWIGSPSALQSLGATAFGTKPVGAGPFMLKEWVRDSQYIFQRNPNYWQKGRPYLDQLVVKIIPDDAAMLQNIQTGAAQAEITYNGQFAQQGKDAGLTLHPIYANGGGWSILFNTSKAPFNDVRVRQAFNLAIDRDAFNKTRRAGDREMTMTTVDRRGTPYYDPKVKVPAYDLAGAQKLIDEVVAAQGGKPIQFTLSYFSVTGYNIDDGQYIAAQISKLKNVEVTQEPTAAGPLVTRYATGAYQALLNLNQSRWNVPALDLSNLYQTGSSGNLSKYSNTAVDAALAQLVTATDPATRKQLVSQVLTQVLKDTPIVWYTRQPSFSIVNKAVKNYASIYDQIVLSDQLQLAKKV